MAAEILIRQRQSAKKRKVFEYRFETGSVNGKRQWISKSGFSTAKEAKIAGTAALAEYRSHSKVATKDSINFSDFLDLWIELECKTSLKSTTITGYRKKIENHIKPALGDYVLQQIRKVDLQIFLNRLHDNGYSKNSITEIKGIITKAFSFAVDEGYLLSAPTHGLKRPKENLQAASRLICTWYFTNMVQPLKSIADEAHFEELLSILRKQHCKPITVHHDNFQFENNEDRQVVIHHLTHARKALHPDDPAVEQVATMSDSELLTLLVKTIGSFRRDSEIHQFNAAKAFNSYLDQVIADSKNAVKESLKPKP